MSWLGRGQGPRDAEDTAEQGPRGENEAISGTADRRVDADTGEILPVRGTTRPGPDGLGRGSERGDAGGIVGRLGTRVGRAGGGDVGHPLRPHVGRQRLLQVLPMQVRVPTRAFCRHR